MRRDDGRPGAQPVEVGPDHPCWAAYGDDDWNGHTFVNWVNNAVKAQSVKLRPPPGLPKEAVDGVWQAVASSAAYVELEGVTCHILKHGQSHCLMAGVPGEWPEGHRWVGFNDPLVAATATCAKCRSEQGLRPPGQTAAG